MRCGVMNGVRYVSGRADVQGLFCASVVVGVGSPIVGEISLRSFRIGYGVGVLYVLMALFFVLRGFYELLR
jgi:hypothetical protein